VCGHWRGRRGMGMEMEMEGERKEEKAVVITNDTN